MLNFLTQNTSELESNIISIERVKEYCQTPHEVLLTILNIYKYNFLIMME